MSQEQNPNTVSAMVMNAQHIPSELAQWTPREFICLGSNIITDGHSAPEVMRRIVLAAYVVN